MATKTATPLRPEQQASLPGIEPAPAEEAPKPMGLTGVVRAPAIRPPRILLYGIHGIGKTTFGTQAPSPIFLCTEDGADNLEVDRWPKIESRKEVLDALRVLVKEPHDYRTVVIDSVDWLEEFILAELKLEFSAKDLSYGKDMMHSEEKMYQVLQALNYLRDQRQMGIVLIAHSEIRRFDSPLTEPYDRYQPKLDRRNSALLQEWADAVLFTTYDISVKREDVGFNREVRRGVTTGDRLMYTSEHQGYYAKNRYALPPELPLNFAELAKHIPYYSEQR